MFNKIKHFIFFSYNNLYRIYYSEVILMNNNDISNLMNVLSKMDKNQLQNGLNQLNNLISSEDKKKIMDAFNSKNNNR